MMSFQRVLNFINRHKKTFVWVVGCKARCTEADSKVAQRIQRDWLEGKGDNKPVGTYTPSVNEDWLLADLHDAGDRK